MHPDTARQIAAERLNDLRREATTSAVRPRRRPLRWRRPGGLARYAGAPAGTRSGT